MDIRTSHRISFLILAYFCILPGLSRAQGNDCEATTLAEFFECYGGIASYSDQSIAAVTTFIQAEDALKAGDYTSAKTLVDALFATYPRGSNVWWSARGDVDGANVGSPHAYYGLRMIEDIADYYLNNSEPVEARKAKMKIVLVGCSEGTQPTNLVELASGGGPFIENTLEPKLVADDYRIVRQSFELMSSYVTAITGGELEVEIEIIELPDVCMDVSVSSDSPLRATGSLEPVWAALSDEVKDDTDWWWMLYPSHVPEFPAFDNSSFITGGMGAASNGGPVFIIDDKWVSRKPAHLGDGTYSDIERRLYLPQWLQHEFFHHLYRVYPELELEVNGHDWFNAAFWPADFEGQFEADYYAETLHKRLQPDCAPLVTRLITRLDDGVVQEVDKLSIDELVGSYSLDNVQNEWHEGRILKQGDRYFWRNAANVQWEVTPNIEEAKLETGPDCPYPGQDFFIELFQTVEGDYVPGAVALKFNGESYKKRFDLLRGSVPIEIALGGYERRPSSSALHAGQIVKEAGQLFWENEAGDRWSLTPNTEEEVFGLNDDSPTPDQAFELIVVEGECGLHVLGFKYLDYYYWKPKRDASNESPTLTNPLTNLELEAGFTTHPVGLAGVFSDPENDTLLFFATSYESSLVSTNVDVQELTLGGGETGDVTILVTAVDFNGGLVTDEFEVGVGEVVSTENGGIPRPPISFSPNPAKNHIFAFGALSAYDISIFSTGGALQQDYQLSGSGARIDLSSFPAGVYLVRVAHKNTGSVTVEKIVKH